MSTLLILAVTIGPVLLAMTLGGLAFDQEPSEAPAPPVEVVLPRMLPPDCSFVGDDWKGPDRFVEVREQYTVEHATKAIAGRGAAAVLEGGRVLRVKGDAPADESWRPLLQRLASAVEGAAWAPFDALHERASEAGVTVTTLGDPPFWSNLQIQVALDVPEDARQRVRAFLIEQGARLRPPHVLFNAPAALDGVSAVDRALEIADQAAQLFDDPLQKLVELGHVARRGDGWGAGVEGVPIAITGRFPRIEMTASLRTSLPDGTLVVHADHGIVDKRLGDPVLDPLLTVQGPDLPALKDRLATEDVRGPLLDVLHGAPGSVLEATRVVCRPPSPLLDPKDWLEKVARLIHALG